MHQQLDMIVVQLATLFAIAASYMTSLNFCFNLFLFSVSELSLSIIEATSREFTLISCNLVLTLKLYVKLSPHMQIHPHHNKEMLYLIEKQSKSIKEERC